MKILAIDIGYSNMGLALAECHKSKINVEYVKKVNLEDYKYIYSNDIVDLVPLFIDDHQFIFGAADLILIERQPPGGLTNVEVLIHYIFKEKTKLISPNSIHTHFGIRNLTYDERKERLTKIASRHLSEEIPYERKHDIADAICMIEYYNFKNSFHFFDKFRYKSNM